MSGSLLNQRNKAMLDKTLLNLDALERYKSASTVRQVAERMGAYHHLHDFHRPYTGSTDEEYKEWRIQEAMIGYEAGQNDSPLPRWIRHYAKKAIQDIRSFDTEWRTGNDPNMTISDLFNRARKLINSTRMATDVAFRLTDLEVDPKGMYRNAFNVAFEESLSRLGEAEKRVGNPRRVSLKSRKGLKESITSEIGDQILPIMKDSIPILEDMIETISAETITDGYRHLWAVEPN